MHDINDRVVTEIRANYTTSATSPDWDEIQEKVLGLNVYCKHIDVAKMLDLAFMLLHVSAPVYVFDGRNRLEMWYMRTETSFVHNIFIIRHSPIFKYVTDVHQPLLDKIEKRGH